MAVQVQYQPDPAIQQALHDIDFECFPGEPMESQTLSVGMRQDFWIAWHDGGLAGFAYLQRRPDISWLSRIGTASAHRRHGVATALLDAVLAHCCRIGLPETMLYVRTDNAEAIRLYRRFGFRSVESSYQFILSDPLHPPVTPTAKPISAVPIDQVPQSWLPSLPRVVRDRHDAPTPYEPRARLPRG